MMYRILLSVVGGILLVTIGSIGVTSAATLNTNDVVDDDFPIEVETITEKRALLEDTAVQTELHASLVEARFEEYVERLERVIGLLETLIERLEESGRDAGEARAALQETRDRLATARGTTMEPVACLNGLADTYRTKANADSTTLATTTVDAVADGDTSACADSLTETQSRLQKVVISARESAAKARATFGE